MYGTIVKYCANHKEVYVKMTIRQNNKKFSQSDLNKYD